MRYVVGTDDGRFVTNSQGNKVADPKVLPSILVAHVDPVFGPVLSLGVGGIARLGCTIHPPRSVNSALRR